MLTDSAAIDGSGRFCYLEISNKGKLLNSERVMCMGSVENLSENIRRLRKQAGLTQEALAAKLFISGQAVSKWERGESYPEITMLPALADALNATADELLRAPALTQVEIAEIAERTWVDKEHQRALTPEERLAALPELEKALERHPEVTFFRTTLASHYSMMADTDWQSGNLEAAKAKYRKVLEVLEPVRDYPEPGDDYYSSDTEYLRVVARYRLGEERDLLWLPVVLFRMPHGVSLAQAGMGRDFYYLIQHSILQELSSMTAAFSMLAFRDPQPGEARLYAELPGTEPWALTPEEKLETRALSVTLLELMGGGKPQGTLLMQLVQARALVIQQAANEGKRERVLSELQALRALCTPEVIREDLAISDVIRKVLFWRMGDPAPDGTPKPETKSGAVTRADAVAALSPEERSRFFTPISALPALKFRYAGDISVDYPPLGLSALQMLDLGNACYDFLRDDPEFQACADYFTAIIRDARKKYGMDG